MPDLYDTGYTVHQPAWHRKDKNVGQYPDSWEEALDLAGIDWDVMQLPVYTVYPGMTAPQLVHGRSFIAKDTTGQIVSGDTVSDDTYAFMPIKGPDGMGKVIEYIFDVADEQRWGLKLETLQSLKDGAVICGSLRLDEPWYVDGDRSARMDYINFRNSWNRSTAFGWGPSSVRTVCSNTDLASQMFWARTGYGIFLKHTAGMKARITEIRDAMRKTVDAMDKTKEFFNALAHRRVNSSDIDVFLDMVFPLQDDKGRPWGDQKMRNQLDRRQQFWNIKASETIEGAGIDTNAYGLVQTVTEWSDHFRGAQSDDTLLERTMFHGDEYKAAAYKAGRVLLKS